MAYMYNRASPANQGVFQWPRPLFTDMKRLLLIPLLVLASCSPKIIERVETKIEYRDRIIHDTTTFEVPYEVEKIVTRDTVSHLKNSFAKSDAIVSGGFLSHSLESIPQIVKVPYEVEVHDTLIVEKEAIERIKEVKVEKPLSWWKQAKIDLFPWLLGLTLVLLVWTFRKPIGKCVRRLLGLG